MGNFRFRLVFQISRYTIDQSKLGIAQIEAYRGGDYKVLKRCAYKALIRCAYKVLRSSIRRSYILLTYAYKVLYSKNRENKVLRSKMGGDYSHPRVSFFGYKTGSRHFQYNS